MSLSAYLVGLADFAAVLAAVLGSAALLLRGRAPEVVGASRVVAFGLVATAVLVFVHVLPAALGVLTRGTVLGAAALTLLGAWAARARTLPVRARRESAALPAWTGVAALPALLGVGAVVVVALATAQRDAALASSGTDMVNIHLPDVARWIQRGSLWPINQFIPGLAHGNYPNNGDFVLLATVLPWHDDFIARLSMLPFYALTGIAVYAGARELRAPASSAALAATLVLALPIVADSAVRDALPDTVMLAAFGGGVCFLLRHWRTRARADLVLAGLGLGIAFGTKWYGVSSVAIVVAIWFAAALVAARGRFAPTRAGALLVGTIAAGGGLWLVRNAIESGNPLFPLRVAPLGVTLLDAPHDVIRAREGFTVASYLGEPSVWRHYLVPAYRAFLGAPGALLGLGALAAAFVALRGRRGIDVRVVGLLAATIALAVVYAVTPYSAQGPLHLPVFAGPNTRYAVPALMLAAVLLGWLAGRAGRARAAIELLAVVAVVLGLRRAFDASAARTLAAAVALAALAALAFGARSWIGGGRLPRRRFVAAAGALTLVVAGIVAAGRHDQRRFDAQRYRDVDAPLALLARASQRHSVALAGDFSSAAISPVFPSFGPRLRNRVAYAGPWVGGMLQHYGDQPGFVAALRRGRYDRVVIGRGFTSRLDQPARPVPEEAWARAAGYRLVAADGVRAVYAKAIS